MRESKKRKKRERERKEEVGKCKKLSSGERNLSTPGSFPVTQGRPFLVIHRDRLV